MENYKLQFELINRRIVQMESVLNNIEDRDNNIYRVYFEASPIPEEQRKAGFGELTDTKILKVLITQI